MNHDFPHPAKDSQTPAFKHTSPRLSRLFSLPLVRPAYAAQYPDCDINNADLNDSGTIFVTDIAPFVQLLTGG